MTKQANKIEALKLRKDILWGLFEDHRAHARHTETLRSTVIGMLIIASAALVTLVTYDKRLNSWDAPAAWLLVGFGLLGAFFSFYHSEKIWKHEVRARVYWIELDETVYVHFEGQPLHEVRSTADKFFVEYFRALGDTHPTTSMEKLVWIWLNWRERRSQERRAHGETEGRVETTTSRLHSLLLWTVLPLCISLIGFPLLLLIPLH